MTVVGYYSLASRIINVLISFIYVIRNATFPYLNRITGDFIKIMKITVGIGFIFSLSVFLFSGILIEPIFGKEANGSLKYLYVLALSPLLIAITTSFGSNKLLVLKKDKLMKNITLVYSTIGFTCALIFIPLYGAFGAALTLLTSRIIMTILTYYATKSFIHITIE